MRPIYYVRKRWRANPGTAACTKRLTFSSSTHHTHRLKCHPHCLSRWRVQSASTAPQLRNTLSSKTYELYFISFKSLVLKKNMTMELLVAFRLSSTRNSIGQRKLYNVPLTGSQCFVRWRKYYICRKRATLDEISLHVSLPVIAGNRNDCA